MIKNFKQYSEILEKIDIERFEISPCIQVMEHELEDWKEFKEREKMSDKELEEIDLIFKEFEVVSSEATSSYKYESKEKHMTPTRYVPLINISGNIRKYTDDYYVVTLREEIFRKRLLQHDMEIEFHLCDQIEGLKAFRDYLKNKINYLKKNLSINESYTSPKKIANSVGHRLETSTHAEFTSRQISQIKELMRDATYRVGNSTLPLEILVRPIKWSRGSTISETPNSVIEIYKGQKWGGGRDTIIEIKAQEDEWFTIRRTIDDQYKDNIGQDEFWRADQFDEVINWLKEELNRIKKTCNMTGKVYESKSNYPQELDHREALRKEKELKPTKFSDYQIDRINKLLSKELQPDEYSLEIEQGGGWWDPEKLSYKTSIRIKGKSISIKAYEDEYFMITKWRETKNTDWWWLCDGFEQLESWLKERFS